MDKPVTRVSSRTAAHGQKSPHHDGEQSAGWPQADAYGQGSQSCDREIRCGDTLLRSSPQDILWDSREGREEMKPAFIALCLWCVELK